MANRILGIDLGAYSVKVVVASPGFRQSTVLDFVERPVPAGDEPHLQRAVRVLGQIVREHGLGGDSAYAAVAGDQLFIHVLEFPFRNLRRADLEKAVGAELEGMLPVDLEDMTFAFDALPADVAAPPAAAPIDELVELDRPLGEGGALIDEEGPTNVQAASVSSVVHGRVAAPTDGMRVLSCAMRRDRAERMISLLGEHGAEPRGLIAAPASYIRIAERLAAGGRASGPIAIIDIGHARTDVCVVKDGRAVFARTVARGGRHVTEAISRSWRLGLAEAESAKHTDGFIASATEPATSDAWQRIHEVVVTEMGPLARDLRQTLSACRAKTGAVVSRAVLVGGGSRLRGTASYLAEQLHVPVSSLGGSDAEAVMGPRLAAMGVPTDLACLAAGVAFEGGTGRPAFDLRTGELSYRADLSFLRAKAAQLAAMVLVIIAFAAGSAYAQLYSLRTAERTLDQRLVLESTEAFGAAHSARETINRAAGVTRADSPLPKMTAYDVLLEINARLPARDAIALDVQDMDIKQGKITIRGSAKTTEEIDQIEQSLRKIECFKQLTRGNISAGPNDTWTFSLSIDATCM
jgi:general secretion pathway protein L